MGTTAFVLSGKNSSPERPWKANTGHQVPTADAEGQSGPIQGAHEEEGVTAGVISSA